MPSAADVRGSERRHVEWWGKFEAALSAIGVGAVGAPLLVWLALDTGATWLFLLAALCPLLIAYGVWERRRLGSAPDKRDGFKPRA